MGRAIPGIGWVWTGIDVTLTALEFAMEYETRNLSPKNKTLYYEGVQRALDISKDNYLCFVAGTKVYTNHGLINIEKISKLDSVYSYNFETHEMELSSVSGKHSKETEGIYQLEIDNETYFVTEEHPFFVVGKDWVKVKNLKIGDLLLSSNGEHLEIKTISNLNLRKTVYNITVDGHHNYFVGKNRVLVHNK